MLNGIDFSYRITPNGPGKIFDFYFQFDTHQKWAIDKGIKIVNDEEFGEITYDFKRTINSTQLFMNMGFDVKFLKHVYFGPSFGVGGRWEFYSYRYLNAPNLNSKHMNLFQDVLLRLNFGVRF